jgi:hypothetical protein
MEIHGSQFSLELSAATSSTDMMLENATLTAGLFTARDPERSPA